MVDIISLLSTDGYIMCNKTLIKLFGGDCAILIGELCAEYLFYKNRGELTPADSFYSTQENIEENTGLNPYAQRKAVKILHEADILAVRKQGIPAKNYYWINAHKLSEIFTTSPSNFKQLDVQNLNLNNNRTNNNKEKENTLSKDKVESTESTEQFLGSAKTVTVDKNDTVNKPKRKSLYEKCIDTVYEYTDDSKLQESLISYLSVRLAVKEKPLYGVNQWKGLLNRLEKIEGNKVEIVQQSIEKGWCSFYEIKDNQYSGKRNIFKVTSETPEMFAAAGKGTVREDDLADAEF